MSLLLDRKIVTGLLIGLAVASTGGAADKFGPVTDAMLTATPAEDWLGFRGNLAGWGFSSLQQVSARNVANLSLAWAWSINPGINEITPLVHNGVLYLANPGGAIQALDAHSGDLIWEYNRKLPSDVVATLGAFTRNLAIYGDSLFTTTGDGHIVALEANTGFVRWDVEAGDYHVILQTTGPIVAKGRVFTGRSCNAALPGGCYILANDAETGKELWRRYIIPRPGEPGDETWNEVPIEERRHVGAWGPGSYDLDLDLLYWGTSVPAPSNEIIRGTAGADVLYSNCTLALDPKTGRIVWYFQHLPRDNWDQDHVFERILVDSVVRPDAEETWVINSHLNPGEKRRLVTGIPGKTGIVWTLDRVTGQFLWARETVKQNLIESIDPETGKVTVNEGVIPKTAKDSFGPVCPSNKGGKNWQPGAFSPQTNALYMPLQNTCANLKPVTDDPTPADGYALLFDVHKDPDAKSLGVLQAISVETGKTLWKYEQRAGMFSVLTTAGRLVFAGDSDRRFRAFDATSGKILWETILQGPVTGTPITYVANDTQYVAVTAGGGDWLSGDYNGIAGLPTVSGSNVLYVFALPGHTAQRDQRIPERTARVMDTHGPQPVFSEAQAERGAAIYNAQCMSCHGRDMVGTFVASAMTGESFISRWAGAPAIQLFNVIRDTMPLQAPGSLDPEAVADLLAYWYRSNGYEAVDKELSPDPRYLEQIRILPKP